MVHKDLGDNHKALEFLIKSQEMRLELYGNKHPDIVDSFQYSHNELSFTRQE